MIKNLKLVIFDMDGLMFDTERRYCEAGEALMRKQGIASDMRAVYDVVGTSLEIDMKRFNLSDRPDDEVKQFLKQAGRCIPGGSACAGRFHQRRQGSGGSRDTLHCCAGYQRTDTGCGKVRIPDRGQPAGCG